MDTTTVELLKELLGKEGFFHDSWVNCSALRLYKEYFGESFPIGNRVAHGKYKMSFEDYDNLILTALWEGKPYTAEDMARDFPGWTGYKPGRLY